MTAYGYFPGCSLRGIGAAYEESFLELFRCLDLSVEELRDWNCCGATSYMSIDEESALLLSARNLALAKRSGCTDLVAPCAACYLVMRKTQDYATKYVTIGKRIGTSLRAAGLPAFDGVRVRHPLEVLYTEIGSARIREKVKRQWHGGQVACYYGCQLVRPYQDVDRDHNPTRMDELLQAVGLRTVEYPLKTKCCGGTLTGTMHEIGVRLNYILLKEAARRGADAIVTVCPLCQYNLDAYQREIARETRHAFDMPILYFTQVLAWSLGAEPERIGLRRAISGRAKIEQWFSPEHAEAKAYV